MSKWKSQILNRLRNKIDNLTNNNQNYKKKRVPPVQKIKMCLHILKNFQKRFVIVTVDIKPLITLASYLKDFMFQEFYK